MQSRFAGLWRGGRLLVEDPNALDVINDKTSFRELLMTYSHRMLRGGGWVGGWGREGGRECSRQAAGQFTLSVDGRAVDAFIFLFSKLWASN